MKRESDKRMESRLLVGYARVSTADQSLALQQDALTSAGCEKIFTEVASGATQARPGLDAALAYLRSGDTLVVWKLDRLGRSLRHLITVVTDLQTDHKGLRSLQEAMDTTTPGGKLIFHVFGALAEFERELTRDSRRREHVDDRGTTSRDDGPDPPDGPTTPGGSRSDG